MAKKKDIHNKTVAEIQKEVLETRTNIDKTRLEISMKKVKNTNAVKTLRKYLAQLLSIKRGKELASS